MRITGILWIEDTETSKDGEALLRWLDEYLGMVALFVRIELKTRGATASYSRAGEAKKLPGDHCPKRRREYARVRPLTYSRCSNKRRGLAWRMRSIHRDGLHAEYD